jgi:hypothetical protein
MPSDLLARDGQITAEAQSKKKKMHGFLLSAPLRLCGLV